MFLFSHTWPSRPRGRPLRPRTPLDHSPLAGWQSLACASTHLTTLPHRGRAWRRHPNHHYRAWRMVVTVAVVSWCGAEAAKAWALPVEVGVETREAPRAEAEATLGRWLRAEPGLAWAPPLRVGGEPMAARLRCSKPHADRGLAEPGPWCWHQACPANSTCAAGLSELLEPTTATPCCCWCRWGWLAVDD